MEVASWNISIVQTGKFDLKVISAASTTALCGQGLDIMIADIVMENFDTDMNDKLKSTRGFENCGTKAEK